MIFPYCLLSLKIETKQNFVINDLLNFSGQLNNVLYLDAEMFDKQDDDDDEDDNGPPPGWDLPPPTPQLAESIPSGKLLHCFLLLVFLSLFTSNDMQT